MPEPPSEHPFPDPTPIRCVVRNGFRQLAAERRSLCIERLFGSLGNRHTNMCSMSSQLANICSTNRCLQAGVTLTTVQGTEKGMSYD
jgi:hypothetical protein